MAKNNQDAGGFSNQIQGLDQIDKTALSEANIAGDATVDLSVDIPSVKVTIKPTLDESALQQALPRLEQQVAFIKRLVAEGGKATEVKPVFNGSKAFSSSSSRASIGMPVINEASSKSNDVDEFRASLEKALNRGRESSGSKKMLDLAKNMAAQRPTLTMDVENTFFNSAKNGDILSASYKHSGSDQVTLINKEFEAIGKRNVEYWKKQKNPDNAKFMQNVLEKLRESSKLAQAGSPNFKLVDNAGMASGLVSAINQNPNAIIQGVRFDTDAKKMSSLIGTAIPATKQAVSALSGSVNLETSFRRHAQLPSEFTRGQSLTHMADYLGVLPKGSTGKAHGSDWDTEVSENIGAALSALDAHEAAYARDNSVKPSPLVKAIQTRVTKPGFVEGWRGRVVADAAIKRIDRIGGGNLYPSVEDAASEAQHIITNARDTGAGTLRDLSAPTTNLHSGSLPISEQQRIAAEMGVKFTGKPEGLAASTVRTAKAQEAGTGLIALSGESPSDTKDNLDAVMKRYALQATDNLRIKSMGNNGKVDAAAIDQELVNLTKGLNADFGPNLRTAEGHYPGNDVLTPSFEHLLNNFPSKTIAEDTKGQIGFKPANAAMLTQEIYGRIRNGISTKDVHLASEPLSIDASNSYLSASVLETPLTQKEAVAGYRNTSDRAVGAKAISGHIFENIVESIPPTSKDLNPKRVQLKEGIDRAKIAKEILEAQTTGEFKFNPGEHLISSTGTQASRDTIASLEELRSKRYMGQGNAFEQSPEIDEFLAKNGYTPVMPTVANGNSKYEHAGQLGGLIGGEGHPDLLASRVEKQGTGFQRRYTLADIKSPQTPVAPGTKLTSLLEDRDRGKWLAQTIAYAQMLPKDIQDNLDIGILTGGPKQAPHMVKDSYSNLKKHPIVRELITQLSGGTDGKPGSLSTLGEYAKPGEMNKANFTPFELNYVAKSSDESQKAMDSYNKALLDLAKNKKISQATPAQLLTQYNTKGLNGNDASPLKLKLDALQATHNVEGGVFGKLPENEFNANTLSLLQTVASKPKTQRRAYLEEAITGPKFQAIDSIAQSFKGFELEIEEAQAKSEVAVQARVANLAGYRANLGKPGADFFRGAFANEPVRGHQGENKDLMSLQGDWQDRPSPLGPGAIGFEDAERRAKLQKRYLAKYTGADLKAQELIHQGEAKLAAKGTTGDTNFIHEFMGPEFTATGAAKTATTTGKGKEKNLTYAGELNRSLQERAYYATQLGTLGDSQSLDDALVKINAARKEKSTQQNAASIERTLSSYSNVVNTNGSDRGINARDYEKNYNALTRAGLKEDQLSQLGFMRPEDLHAANQGDKQYQQGYTGSILASAYSDTIADYNRKTSSVSDKEYDTLARRSSTLGLNRQVNEHAANYIDQHGTTDQKGLAEEKRKAAEKASIEEAALNDFLSKQGRGALVVPPEFHTPDTALQVIQGDREEKLKKHRNNAMLAQTEASNFVLTPELLKNYDTSIAGIKALGGKPSKMGLERSAMFLRPMEGFGPSRELSDVTSKLSGATGFKAKALATLARDEYVASLTSTTTEDPRIKQFENLAKAIERGKLKLDELNKAMESAPAGSASATMIQQQIDSTQGKLDLRKKKISEVPSIGNLLGGPINDEELAVHQATYSKSKLSKSINTRENAGMLIAEFQAEGFSPDLMKRVNKLDTEGKGIFDQKVSKTDIVDKYKEYVKSPAASRNQDVEVSPTMSKFITSSQVVSNYKDTKTSMGSNTFDAIHQKEQTALSLINSLKTALTETNSISMSGLEAAFKRVHDRVEQNISALADFQQKTGYSASHPEVAVQRQAIDKDINGLTAIQQKMVSQRPKLNDDAWKLMVTDAGQNAEVSKYDAVKRAMSANAKVQALGENASYSDIQEQHAAAKDLRQRNIPFAGNKGLLTEHQVEQNAKKMGKTNFEDVSFTEQLVDLANWQVQWAGATAVTQGFTTALYGGFGAAKQFEAGMKDVELISQASSVQIEALKEKVLALGSNFKVPTKELAEGLVILGQAGYKASDSINMIQPISQLAIATGSTHKEASDITTSVMMAYDTPSSKTADVTNTLAAATIESKLELGALGTTFNYIGSTAAMAGLSIEETATAMGLMSNAGVKASTIGTSLRSIIGALIAPTANFKAELGRVGISIDELNPRTNNLGGIFSTLNSKGFNVENAFEGMNKREAGAMTSLLNQGDKWGEFKGSISGTDRAETMAYGQMDTFDAQVKKMKNNAEIAGIKSFEGSMPVLKTAASIGSLGFETIGNMAESSAGKAITSLASISVAALTATTIVGGLAKAFITVRPAISDGIRKAWGSAPIHQTPEGTRGKIYEGVTSMIGMAAAKPLVLIAAGVAATAYAGNKIYEGDKLLGIDTKNNPFSRKIAPLREQTMRSDYMSNLAESLKVADRQQKEMNQADRGPDTERKSYLALLANTGLYAGRDAQGNLVDSTQKNHLPISSLAADPSKLNLAVVSRTISNYNDTLSTPKLLRQLAETGNAKIRSYDDVNSEKGSMHIQATSDKFIEAMKRQNIVYDEPKSETFLNDMLGTGSTADNATKLAIEEKLSVIRKADNRAEIEKSSNKEAFKRSAQASMDLDTTLLNPASKDAYSYTGAVDKRFIKDELNEPGVAAAFKKYKSLGLTNEKYKAAYDNPDLADKPEERKKIMDRYLSMLESAGGMSGLESLKGIKARYQKEQESNVSPLAGTKAKQKMVEDYERHLATSPEDAKNSTDVATAKLQFDKKVAIEGTKYGEVRGSLAKAETELSSMSVTDPGYKAKAVEVQALKMYVDELASSMKNLMENSFSFGMPGVEQKLIPTIKDLKYPAKFANESPDSVMKYMPTMAIGEFRTQSSAIEGKYKTLKEQALVSGDINAVQRVNLAWKLEIEDLENDLIAKATIKVKEASAKLDQIITRELGNKTTGIQLNADLGNIGIDMKASDAKRDAILAPRTTIVGDQRRASIDYSEHGFPSPLPRYNALPWNESANLFSTSSYSADSAFLTNIQAEMDKLKISRSSRVELLTVSNDSALEAREQGVKTAWAKAPGAEFNIPKTPAEMVEITSTTPKSVKEGLMAVEEKYQQSRIAASQKALQSILKDIQTEMAARDKLLDKIKTLEDNKQGFAESMDDDRKALLKSAGIDTRESPAQIANNNKALLAQAEIFASKGEVENVEKIGKKITKNNRALATEDYSSSDRLAAVKDIDKLAALHSKASDIAINKSKGLVGKIDSGLTLDKGSLDTSADAIRLGIARSTGLSISEKEFQTKEFDTRLAAAGSSPEKMKVIQDVVAANPELVSSNTGDQAFKYLVETVPQLTEKFKDLIAVMGEITGKGSKTGDKEQKSLASFVKSVGSNVASVFGVSKAEAGIDVTPSKASIAELIGPAAFEHLGLNKMNKMPVIQILDEMPGGADGSFNRSKNLIKATSKTALGEELAHFGDTASYNTETGTPVNGMAREAYAKANNPFLSDAAYNAKYPELPRNTDFRNLSKADQQKLYRQPESQKYLRAGAFSEQFSLSDIPSHTFAEAASGFRTDTNEFGQKTQVQIGKGEMSIPERAANYGYTKLKESGREIPMFLDSLGSGGGFAGGGSYVYQTSAKVLGETTNLLKPFKSLLKPAVKPRASWGAKVLSHVDEAGRPIYKKAAPAAENIATNNANNIVTGTAETIEHNAVNIGSTVDTGVTAGADVVDRAVAEMIRARNFVKSGGKSWVDGASGKTKKVLDFFGGIRTGVSNAAYKSPIKANITGMAVAGVTSKKAYDEYRKSNFTDPIGDIDTKAATEKAKVAAKVNPVSTAASSMDWNSYMEGSDTRIEESKGRVKEMQARMLAQGGTYDKETGIVTPISIEAHMAKSQMRVGMTDKEFKANQVQTRKTELAKGRDKAEVNRELGFNEDYGVKKGAPMWPSMNDKDINGNESLDKYRNIGESDYMKVLGPESPANTAISQVENVLNSTTANGTAKALNGMGVDLSTVTKDKFGGFNGKDLAGNYFSAGSDTSMAANIEANLKGQDASQMSLKDRAPQGALAALTDMTNKAPNVADQSVGAGNEKLIAALDSLRSSLEKASGTSTPGTTPTGAAGATNNGMAVTVNAPVTVTTSSNGGGSSQDPTAVVTKICTEFFDKEFNNRYVAAVNTVSVG